MPFLLNCRREDRKLLYLLVSAIEIRWQRQPDTSVKELVQQKAALHALRNQTNCSESNWLQVTTSHVFFWLTLLKEDTAQL